MHLHLPKFLHAILLIKGSYRVKHELTQIYFFMILQQRLKDQ